MQVFSRQLRDSLHPAALLFIERIYATTGTKPNSDEIRAIDFLTTSLISVGLWQKFRAIYPFVGRSGKSMGFNLKNPYRHNIVWYNSLKFDKDGVTNVSTGYGNTFVAPSWFSDDNIHVSVYNATPWNGTSAECALIGSTPDSSIATWMHTISLRRRPVSFRNNDPAQGLSVFPIFTYSCGTYPPYRCAGFDAGDQLNAQAWGLIVGVNGIFCYTGGKKLGATSQLTDPLSSKINPTQKGSHGFDVPTYSQYPFLIFAHRPFGSVNPVIGGQIEKTGMANIRFASIGEAINDQENETFYSIVEEFQKILKRDVGTYRLGESDVLVDETNPRPVPKLRINRITALKSKHLYKMVDLLEDRFSVKEQLIQPELLINSIKVFGPRKVYLSDESIANVNILDFTEI